MPARDAQLERGAAPVAAVPGERGQDPWIVEAGDHSFTAILKGTLNTMTGKVEMDGTVVEGWLVGAQVHEEGQLVDPLLGRFQGTISIFPATAD